MNASTLLLSLVFGTVGMGFVMYAKRAGEFIPAVVGIALMVIPYFFASAWVMLLVCGALTAVPFVVRDR